MGPDGPTGQLGKWSIGKDKSYPDYVHNLGVAATFAGQAFSVRPGSRVFFVRSSASQRPALANFVVRVCKRVSLPNANYN